MHDRIERTGVRCISIAADLTRFDEFEGMRVLAEKELGYIDLLVANAGGNYAPPGPIEEMTEEGWKQTVEGNLTLTFLTLKSVLPGMKERRHGTVITISSAAGRRPHPGSPIAYAAAKAAIELLTQDVAVQCGPFGIRANCIAPEIILTERNQEQIPAAQQDQLISMHPTRRLGTVEDVAQAALYLASEGSSWVTGIVLDVAGGAVMK